MQALLAPAHWQKETDTRARTSMHAPDDINPALPVVTVDYGIMVYAFLWIISSIVALLPATGRAKVQEELKCLPIVSIVVPFLG